jgi:hypothetical protein
LGIIKKEYLIFQDKIDENNQSGFIIKNSVIRDISIMSERISPVYLLQLKYYPLRLQCNVNRKDEHQPKYLVSAREWGGFWVQKLCNFIKVRVRNVSSCSYITPLH